MKRAVGVLFLGVIIVVAALWVRARSGGGTAAAAQQAVSVERGTVELTVSADGLLVPLTTVAVKSYAGGRVDVLAVQVGDRVAKGDLIAKIDPTDSLSAYEQARADLDAARARLEQAREQAQSQPAMTQAAIAQAEASHAAALQDLAYIRDAKQPQQRADARSALNKARANLDLAERDLARMRGLKEQGFVPQSEVDSALNRRDLAAAELDSAEERWGTLERQLSAELQAAEARVAQSKASLDRAKLDAVQDRIRKADVTTAQAQVARAQAQLTNAKTTLEYTTITAPRAGVILQKFVEEGTIVTSGRSSVTQGTDIVLLGDLTEMFVEVSVDEADVGMVRAGQPADITVDALPDERFRGTITRIDPQAVTQQNVTTVLVTVRVDDADPRLKPGMTVTCEFLIGQAENVLCLPNLAVQERQGEHVVLILQGEEPVPVPVEVGLVGDNLTEIRGGVAEGAEVVLPFHGAPPGERRDWARERGRRMGGAGGFVRSN